MYNEVYWLKVQRNMHVELTMHDAALVGENFSLMDLVCQKAIIRENVFSLMMVE
jgi:hypothetical protein